MKKLIDGLCDPSTYLNQLKKIKLWLYSGYYKSANKNGILQANKSHY